MPVLVASICGDVTLSLDAAAGICTGFPSKITWTPKRLTVYLGSELALRMTSAGSLVIGPWWPRAALSIS